MLAGRELETRLLWELRHRERAGLFPLLGVVRVAGVVGVLGGTSRIRVLFLLVIPFQLVPSSLRNGVFLILLLHH